ncbi:hypothetical protein ACFQX6_65105 [Streptosporangium lutulentum]
MSSWIYLLTSVLFAVVIVELLRRALRWRLIGEKWVLAAPLVRRCTWPAFMTAAVVTAYAVYEPGMADDSISPLIQRLLSLAMIGGVSWLVIQAAFAVTDVVLDRLVAVEGRATGGLAGSAPRSPWSAGWPRR